MVIGVIGKVGSGKSAAVEFIEREYKAIVFSCDEIAKDIIEKKETFVSEKNNNNLKLAFEIKNKSEFSSSSSSSSSLGSDNKK